MMNSSTYLWCYKDAGISFMRFPGIGTGTPAVGELELRIKDGGIYHIFLDDNRLRQLATTLNDAVVVLDEAQATTV